MRRFSVILLLIICCLSAFAQKSRNELFADLSNARTDTQKISIYQALMEYYAVENPDSESWVAQQAISFARSRDFRQGEATILGKEGIIDQTLGRTEVWKQHTIDALSIFRQIHDLTGVAEMLHNLGSGEASQGNFVVAIGYFLNALKVYDSVTDKHGQLLAYMNLGNIYFVQGDTANAMKHFIQAEKVSHETPVSDATIFLYNIFGVYFAEAGRVDTAIKIFVRNVAMSDKPEFVKSHMESLLYLADTYIDLGQIAKGKYYLSEGVEAAKKDNNLEMQSNFLIDLARVAGQEDPKAGIAYLEQARDICQKIRGKTYLIQVYEEMARIYKKNGDYKNALAATEQKQKVADSVFNINKRKEIEKIDAVYELEKNDRIAKLELLNRKNVAKRNVIIVVTAVIFVTLIVLMINFRKSIMLNRRLAHREKELQELNNMKDKLFSIIGHDLRSPLTQVPAILEIYNDPQTSEDEKTFMFENLREHSMASLETLDKLLLWGKSLVKGISISPQKLKTKKYISQNIELKKSAAIEKNITITDATPADAFVYSDATHFDFVIRNLLANSIKYTNVGGRIEINADMASMAGYIVFSVKDNGVGIEKNMLGEIFNPLSSREGTANEKGTGIGLMLCREFAVRNGGDIWVESEPGKGSTFYYSVKNAA